MVDYLRAKNLPMRLVMAPDPALDRPDWPAMLEIRRGRAEDADPVGLTTAFAGIAETGTLMLLSGPRDSHHHRFPARDLDRRAAGGPGAARL